MAAVLEQIRHRLTTSDYHKMGDAGIFAASDRVELIEGEIIDMAPIGIPHSGVVDLLTNRLVTAVAEQAIVHAQNPVVLGEHSEPQLDIALLRPRADFYRKAHPTPVDILLLIEVAETSLRFDREIKLPLYARHQVPEVWIIDLLHRRLDIHRDPEGGQYRQASTPDDLAHLTPALLPQSAVNLADLFDF